MRTLAKLILGTAVAGSALVAIPAQAQPYENARYEHDRYEPRWNDRGQARAISAQIQELERRIARTDGRDRISEREAAALRRSLYDVRARYRDYARNGLDQREARILQSRLNQIRQRLGYERRDTDGRRW